jgi:hypothetical protein
MLSSIGTKRPCKMDFTAINGQVKNGGIPVEVQSMNCIATVDPEQVMWIYDSKLPIWTSSKEL